MVCVSTRREEWGRRCGVSVREGGGSVCYMCYVSCHGGQGGTVLINHGVEGEGSVSRPSLVWVPLLHWVPDSVAVVCACVRV